MKKITQLATVALLCLCSVNLSAANNDEYRRWVVAMKEAPRGPFSRIRWFCHDGAVLAPESYACAKHGGGVQHGEYTTHIQELRDNGYYIANLLAGEDIPALVDSANFNKSTE